MTDTVTVQSTLTVVPARTLFAVDGGGGSEDAAFAAAVAALFAARGSAGDVPLEGTYWMKDDPARFDLHAPELWRWTLAVPAPDGAAPAGVERREVPAQLVAEVEYVGAYADEGPTLAALYADLRARRLEPTGPHTEVYLTDPSTTAPGDNRTLLRVPVAG